MNTILTLVALFLVYKIISSAIAAKKEREQQRQIEAIKREQEQRRAEDARMKAEYKRQQVAAKEWQRRQIALEKEQIRQAKEQERLAKEQEKQAEVLRKHEAKIHDLEMRMEWAEEDINNLAYQIEEQQKYSKFLQEQRDKCSADSSEYFKWQNKLTVVDQKVYRLNKQKQKAIYEKEKAERQLSA